MSILSTQNAGGLVGINNTTAGTVKVRMLIGTRVESLGRDVNEGEVVTISQKDASFLLPYNYATRDLEVEEVEAEDGTVEDTDDSADDEHDEHDEDDAETTDEGESEDEAPETGVAASTGKRTGKRQA